MAIRGGAMLHVPGNLATVGFSRCKSHGRHRSADRGFGGTEQRHLAMTSGGVCGLLKLDILGPTLQTQMT